MNIMIIVMIVKIMVMIFVQSKFGGLLKTHFLKIGLAFREICVFWRNFFASSTAVANFFVADFGCFLFKNIMHACRLGWPSGARTATLDGRSWRRRRTGDKEKYYFKDVKGDKKDIEEKTK